jgi:hypothetical protein
LRLARVWIWTGSTCMMRHVSRAWPAPTNQNTPMPAPGQGKVLYRRKKTSYKKKTQRTPEPPENPDCSVLTPAVSFPVHLAGGARARSLLESWPTTGRPPPQPYGRCPGPGAFPATSSHQVSARHLLPFPFYCAKPSTRTLAWSYLDACVRIRSSTYKLMHSLFHYPYTYDGVRAQWFSRSVSCIKK